MNNDIFIQLIKNFDLCTVFLLEYLIEFRLSETVTKFGLRCFKFLLYLYYN